MGFLTVIFTKSVGTSQPTRPLDRVCSKLNGQSEEQCQRTHSKWGWFCFFPILTKQIQPLNRLKKASKVDDLSLTIAIAALFCAFALVLAIGYCMFGPQRYPVWLDLLNWWLWPWVPAFWFNFTWWERPCLPKQWLKNLYAAEIVMSNGLYWIFQ